MENERERAARELAELFKEPAKNFGGCLFWVLVIIVIIIAA